MQSLPNVKLRELGNTKKGNLWGYKEQAGDVSYQFAYHGFYAFQLNHKLKGITERYILENIKQTRSIKAQHLSRRKEKIDISCCLYITKD